VLTTQIKALNGVIDFLGVRKTYHLNGAEVPIELCFDWDVNQDKRVTKALVDEWVHLLEVVSNFLPKQNINHLSIGGGGDSRLGGKLSKETQNWIVLNPNEYELQNVRNPKKIDTILIRAIGEDVPIKSESIDCIDILGTIDHVIDPDKVFKEASRVLKSEASLIVSVTNSTSWYKRLFRLLHISVPNQHAHAHSFNPTYLSELLIKNGLHVKQMKTTYFLRLPLFIEKRIKNARIRSARNLLSNFVLPYILGKSRGGIIICLAVKTKAR